MPALISVGLSHHAASVEIRERLAFDQARWLECAPASLPTVLLSTCNRVEVYAWAEGRPATGIQRIERALARAAGLAPGDLQPYLVRRRGRDALVHLVRVAAGLDSLVVGEEQIRGQIREAVRLANDAHRLPPSLRGIFDRVAESARRVRGGTRLGSVPSIASAAIHVAQRTLPDPGRPVSRRAGRGRHGQDRCAVPARGGRKSDPAQPHARARTHRQPHAAGRCAWSARWTIYPPRSPTRCCWSARRHLASQSCTLARCGRRSPQREYPLLVLDIAVPRDVEPGVRALPDVQLIDMDDLERLCPVDISVRQAELQHAETLAAAEAERIAHWLRLRSASPAIAELRSFGETVRRRELSRSSARLKDLTPEQIAAVDALTTGIVNKLLARTDPRFAGCGHTPERSESLADAHPARRASETRKDRLMRDRLVSTGRAQFPLSRPRRLRRTDAVRRMVRETRLSVDRLIYPLFVVPGADVQEEISAMPGVFHMSVDRVVEEARAVADLGIPALLLFGLPRTKDWEGSEAWAADGVVQQAMRAIRRAAPSLVLMADTCLCEYTSHGHCGLPGRRGPGCFIDNDASVELLTRAGGLAGRGGRRLRRALRHDRWPRGGHPRRARRAPA